jgi:D-sedoheptulose 7-phosphate isomerase
MWEMNILNIEQEIDAFFTKVIQTLGTIDKTNLKKFVDLLLDAYHQESTIFIFGNGGSANTASHFCGDFVKGVSCGQDKRFRVICLNDNVSALMAVANDISYEDIFVEQLKNFLKKDDLVIGISCSGNSPNIIKALEFANTIGAVTVAMCGFQGGKIKQIANLVLRADIDDMEISEDIHLIIAHFSKQMIIKLLHAQDH